MFKSCGTCNLSPREFFLLGSRLAFGLWLLYAGLVKWIGGPEAFVGYITTEFGKTWSPAPLNTALAWLIIAAEPLIGFWLIAGVRQRCAWTSAALLMFLLTMGMTILGKTDVIGNFQYFFLCLACAALSNPSICSVESKA